MCSRAGVEVADGVACLLKSDPMECDSPDTLYASVRIDQIVGRFARLKKIVSTYRRETPRGLTSARSRYGKAPRGFPPFKGKERGLRSDGTIH